MKGFMTSGQLQMKEACLSAFKNQSLIMIESPHGAGLQHSVQNLVNFSPHVKVVYLDCLDKRSSRNIFVTLLREAMNIRFSNVNYLYLSLDDLLMVVKNRMKADLKSVNVVIVIDHIDKLNKNQLAYLPRLLTFRKLPCGIVLRTTTSHRLSLNNSKHDSDKKLHDELYVNFIREKPIVIAMPQKKERMIFIRDVHGINDEGFLKDLAKNPWGFSKMLEFIERYKGKMGA